MNERTNERARLVLASASPRRRELLSMFELDFEIEPADIDESVRRGEPACDYVQRMAAEKAQTVAVSRPDDYVLGADTAVVVDGDCLGKPGNRGEARAMLERLSGRSHQVFSAVALLVPGGAVHETLSETEVTFAELPAVWIDAYLHTEEPYDKAGAYGVQGAAGVWVKRLEGSYTGVVGLPLFETGEVLRRAGFPASAILAGNDRMTGSSARE